MTMRVCSPQVRATLMPPPLGMCRSHTTRSGFVALITSMASSASPASPTTWKFSPRSARTPERQIGWSSAMHHPHGRHAGNPQPHLRSLAARPSISTRPPTSSIRPRIDRVMPTPSGVSARSKPAPSSLTEQNTHAVPVGVDVDRGRRARAPCLPALVSASLTAPRSASRASVSRSGSITATTFAVPP